MANLPFLSRLGSAAVVASLFLSLAACHRATDARQHTENGRTALAAGDYSKALGEINEAVRLVPDDPYLYRLRACVHDRLKNSDAAKADFDKAIALAPTDPDGYSARAFFYSQLGWFDKAAADARQAADLAPLAPPNGAWVEIGSVSVKNPLAPTSLNFLPCIRQISDLGRITPVEFLEILKRREIPEYTFESLDHWVTKYDVPGLLALVDSKESCSSVASVYSSYYNSQYSTVGQEALFMLEGYRKGKYPPALNSGISDDDKEELVRWLRKEMRGVDGI